MPSFLAYPLEMIPYVLVTLLIAFTIHEWAHALVALAFGLRCPQLLWGIQNMK